MTPEVPAFVFGRIGSASRVFLVQSIGPSQPIVQASSLLRYRPEILHSSDQIFGGLPGRQKLRVNSDLHRAEFPRVREIFANLLEGPSKLGPVFFDGRFVNFDTRRNNKLDREGSRPASLAMFLIPSNIAPTPLSGIPTESQALASAATRFMAEGVNAAI